jgi:hypothetical protein
MQKRMSGGELQPAERALLGRVFGQMGGGRSGGQSSGSGGASASAFGGTFIVFKKHQGRPVATEVRTGLTDFDYVEVTQGLVEGDTVLVLPSASLIAQQQEFRDRVQRMGGGGIPGMQQQQQQRPASGSSGQRPQSR